MSKHKKFICRRANCPRAQCTDPFCPFDTRPDHNYVALAWHHMVPDHELQDLNWALEVAKAEDPDTTPEYLYLLIQSEMARRGMTTYLSQQWLARWQKKQNQRSKPESQHFGYDRKSKIKET